MSTLSTQQLDTLLARNLRPGIRIDANALRNIQDAFQPIDGAPQLALLTLEAPGLSEHRAAMGLGKSDTHALVLTAEGGAMLYPGEQRAIEAALDLIDNAGAELARQTRAGNRATPSRAHGNIDVLGALGGLITQTMGTLFRAPGRLFGRGAPLNASASTGFEVAAPFIDNYGDLADDSGADTHIAPGDVGYFDSLLSTHVDNGAAYANRVRATAGDQVARELESGQLSDESRAILAHSVAQDPALAAAMSRYKASAQALSEGIDRLDIDQMFKSGLHKDDAFDIADMIDRKKGLLKMSVLEDGREVKTDSIFEKLRDFARRLVDTVKSLLKPTHAAAM